MLDLLIELGADVDAKDMNGQTSLSVAMLSGDREAMARLHAAGAAPPEAIDASNFSQGDGHDGRVRQEGRPDDLCPGCRPCPRLVQLRSDSRKWRDTRTTRRELRHGVVREGRTHAEHARQDRARTT